MQKPYQITSIYDNSNTDDASLDCMTFVLDWIEGPRGELACLATSRNGLGFSQFSYCDDGPHLGDKIDWNDLPLDLQRHVIARLSD